MDNESKCPVPACRGSLVPRKWIWKFVSTFGLALLLFGGLLYARQGEKAEQSDLEKVRERTSVVEARQEGVKERLDRLETTMKAGQERLADKLDTLSKDLMRMLRRTEYR